MRRSLPMLLLLTPRATNVSTSISRLLSERSTGPRARPMSLQATAGESTDSPRAVARMALNSSSLGATVFALVPLALHGGPLWEPLYYAQIGFQRR
jgi:hypothetical protein